MACRKRKMYEIKPKIFKVPFMLDLDDESKIINKL